MGKEVVVVPRWVLLVLLGAVVVTLMVLRGTAVLAAMGGRMMVLVLGVAGIMFLLGRSGRGGK